MRRPLVWLCLLAAVLATRGYPQVGKQVQRGIVYGTTADGAALTFDLYRPATDARTPLLVWFHGGAWMRGTAQRPGLGTLKLVERGFTVAAVEYSLAPRYPMPAPVEDAKRALRFLRANADRFGVDPERIGVWGMSAGGTLAELLAVAGTAPGPPIGHLEPENEIQAAAGISAPTNFITVRGPERDTILANAFPPPTRDEMMVRVSPELHVRSGAPPILIIHGTHDLHVDITQATTMEKALRACGDPVETLILQGIGHDLRPASGRGRSRRVEVEEALIRFFTATLHP
jgi:acetyl esterase/lipase